MSVSEVILLIIRWLHSIAAVAWVGGGLFYLLILRPSLRRSHGTADAAIGQDFRALVATAMGVLVVTGIVMTFNRLTSDFVGAAYVIVLAIKIAMALYMFYLVRFLRSRTYPNDPQEEATGYRRWVTGGTTVVILGVIVFLLADILSALFEEGLRG